MMREESIGRCKSTCNKVDFRSLPTGKQLYSAFDSTLSIYSRSVIDMGKTTKCDDLYQLIGEIFQANGKLLASGDRLSAQHGLTGARWQVLGALNVENQPLTVAQIARRMGLQRQSVQRLVDIMVKQGILICLPNPEHKRARLVDLTKYGKKVCEQLAVTKGCWADDIVKSFSQDELQAAIQVLRKLGEELE